MISKEVISKDAAGNELLNHIVAGSTYSAAPALATDGFEIRRSAARNYDAMELTFSFDGTADATTEAWVRPWFYVVDHDPTGSAPVWLSGKVQKGITVPTASTEAMAPVRRIGSIPVGATKMYLQVVQINGTAPANLYMMVFGLEGNSAAGVDDLSQAASGSTPGSATYTSVVGTLGMMAGDDIYTSPYHFTAAYQAATAIDLTGGFPTITNVSQFVGVVEVTSAGLWLTPIYPSPTQAFSWDGANNRLTVAGASFTNTSNFIVVVRGPDRAKSLPDNHRLTAITNHYPLRSDDGGIALITSAANFTGAWADLGGEIPMFGFNTLKLWLTLDVNLGSDLRVRILDKHTSGGAEEYQTSINSVTSSVILIEPAYWEFNTDVDQLATLVYKGDGMTPYVQVQIQAGTAGGTPAQVDAAYYTRGWR